MTKICSNCKTENPNSTVFCQECGNKLLRTEKTNQTKNRFKGWWEKQGNGVKGISLLGACCVGLIVSLTIIGMMLPDTPTTNTTNTPQNTTSTTQQVQKVEPPKETATKDVWATEYPKLTDTCPNCGSKAQLDEKTDKVLNFYCKNCNGFYGADMGDTQIIFDPLDGVSPLKYFPIK